jgi:26S proteasome regulatory subunit N3
MDRNLTRHLALIRPQIKVDALSEAINSHCNASFSPILIQSLREVSEDASSVEMTDAKEAIPIVPVSLKPFTMEADLLLGLMTLVCLLDKKHLVAAKAVADNLATRCKAINNSLDMLVSKIYFYQARVYELTSSLASLRPHLLVAYRSASVHHSPTKQAVLINLILRSYFLQGLIDQASKFASKVSFPDTRSNAEYARYLYYIGLIKGIQLEYSDSHSCLMQAIRKAPQEAIGVGFKVCAIKAAIIIELLMGAIPERNTFNEFKDHLRPYLEITQAVRSGDVSNFTGLLRRYETLFVQDRLYSLIRRLHQNVIKAGLKGIAASYSRITLVDVARKLGLASVDEAADVAAKAIVDGVIDAKICYEKGYLESSWGEDIYSTADPAKQLHKRIAFCLQLHTETVKAMQYPDMNEMEKELMETNEEILRAQKMDLEDIGSEDDDLMM